MVPLLNAFNNFFYKLTYKKIEKKF
jgi:hypothetical protein